jgi:hypothetical protein
MLYYSNFYVKPRREKRLKAAGGQKSQRKLLPR